MSTRLFCALLPLVVCAPACKKSDDAPVEPEVTGLDDFPGGNPLAPAVPAFPYPSDLYLEADSSTLTGRRLVIPEAVVPGEVLPEQWADDDGYSRISPLLTSVDGGIDPATLPGEDDPEGSIADASTIWLVEEGTWRLIPILAELDLLANSQLDQALIIRPLHALQPGTGYAVIMKSGLKHADGTPVQASDAFRALRDGLLSDSEELEAQRPDFDQIWLGAVGALGLETQDLVAGWTFHTRSREQVVDPVLHMHDVMYSYDMAPPVLDPVGRLDEGDDLTIYTGTFEVPDFIGPELALELDAQGLPIQKGTQVVDFNVTIPNSLTGPRPVIAYGHGFFSNKEEAERSLADGLNHWQMVAISIDFDGFNESESLDTITRMAGNLQQLDTVVAQQLQAQAKFTAVARLVSEHLADLVEHDGTYPLDADQVVYMGISNGGTQGLSILAASPAFSRGAVVVPGSGWSHMLQRADQWRTMGALFNMEFDRQDHLQLAIAMAQNRMDPADAINSIDHLWTERFDGRQPMEVSLHEAVHDSQVANLTTHMAARTAAVPLVTPSPLDIWGLDTVGPSGDGSAAGLFVYDEHVAAPPDGNVPPEYDNDTHGTVRDLAAYLDQMGHFLETGEIVQVCDGACDPD